jgi:hypothetical protein
VTSPPPGWATQVPSAPVQRPPAKAFQITQPSTAQVQAMQQQLLQSIWEGFLQIVDGFLLPDTAASDQLAAWWTDVQNQFNQISTELQRSWLTFQNVINSVVGGIDKDVLDLINALNTTGGNALTAIANWDTLFLDLGFSVTTASQLATWLGGTNTTAVNGSAWATRLTNDLLITSDVFHLVYNVGLSTDAPGTLGVGGVGPGKPTWYSAWNDLLALTGLVNSVTAPTDPAPTVGAAIGTAQTTATTASGNVQNVADAVHQTVYGGTATGTPTDVATLVTALSNQPAATVVPPPNPNSSGMVAHGATGSSWTTNTTAGNFLTITGSHTAAASDNYVVVPIIFDASTSVLTSINRTVTYGTQSMSSLGALQINSVSNVWVEFFGLFGPVAGAQTITATIASINTLNGLLGSSSSYSGVGTVGALTTTTGASANPSQTVSSAVGDMVVQAFAAFRTGGSALTMSSYSQTQRSNSGSVAVGSFALVLDFGDAVGAASVSFAATASSTSGEFFGGMAVNLIPQPAIIGSGFRAYNNSTTAINGSSGDNTFPNSFFNTVDLTSPDLTYSTATANTLTVANAGWYKIVIHCLEAAVFTTHYVRPVLYHNGTAARQGPVLLVNTTAANTYTFGFTWSIYCQAGDTLQPGYNLNTPVSSVFVGETTGAYTYWEASLMNRSLL